MAEKPLLIYDGECRFCCRGIEACRAITGDRVEYETSQNAAPRFPDIPPEEFARAVQWIAEDGSLCSGAQAVFSALATTRRSGRLLLSLYQKMPVFAHLSETVYAGVASHRNFFSSLTRMLGENDKRPPAPPETTRKAGQSTRAQS